MTMGEWIKNGLEIGIKDVHHLYAVLAVMWLWNVALTVWCWINSDRGKMR